MDNLLTASYSSQPELALFKLLLKAQKNNSFDNYDLKVVTFLKPIFNKHEYCANVLILVYFVLSEKLEHGLNPEEIKILKILSFCDSEI